MQLSRESVFVSAIRAFCNTLFSILGVGIALFLLFLFIGFGKSAKGGIEIPPPAKPVISFDSDGNRKLLPDTAPVILKMDIHGVIGDIKLNAKNFATKLHDSQSSLLAGRIKAVLLHINTPGGTTVDSDGIYQAILEYKKKYNVPVYAFVDGLCASGGMYVASAADKIFSTPVSVIGSVGVVVGPAFNFVDLMNKMGVEALTLTEGLDKDMLNPFRKWGQNEGDVLKSIIESQYTRFVNIVSSARPKLSKQLLINNYGARVYDAAKAQELGYIDDGDSSYKMALTELSNAAGLKENEEVQVVEFKIPRSFFTDIFEESELCNGKIKHELVYPGSELTQFAGQMLYLYQP